MRNMRGQKIFMMLFYMHLSISVKCQVGDMIWNNNYLTYSVDGQKTIYRKEKFLEIPVYKISNKDLLEFLDMIVVLLDRSIQQQYQRIDVAYRIHMNIDTAGHDTVIAIHVDNINQWVRKWYNVEFSPDNIIGNGWTFYNHVVIRIYTKDVENGYGLLKKTNLIMLVAFFRATNNKSYLKIKDGEKMLYVKCRYTKGRIIIEEIDGEYGIYLLDVLKNGNSQAFQMSNELKKKIEN